jgi:hypothetical protein
MTWEALVKFISLRSVTQALQERRWWAFCAAMTTDQPVIVGPNLRILRGAI